MRLASLPWYDLREVRGAHDALWAALADRLRSRGFADVPRQLEREVDYVTQWRSGRLLVGQACGYDVANGEAETLRIVATPRFDFEGCHEAQYRSFVVVHRDSPARSLADLRGSCCVINNETSHSGMNSLRNLLAPLHSEGRFFARVVASGGHEHSVEMVASGRADVAAIDCITHGLLARHRPQALARLRILDTTDLAPAPPFVTSSSTSDEDVETIRSALAAVLEDETVSVAWSDLRLAGIEQLPPGAYDSMSSHRSPRRCASSLGERPHQAG